MAISKRFLTAYEKAMDRIRLSVGEEVFSIWLGGSHVAAVHGSSLVIHLSSDYRTEWVRTRWSRLVTREIIDCFRIYAKHRVTEVQYETEPWKDGS